MESRKIPTKIKFINFFNVQTGPDPKIDYAFVANYNQFHYVYFVVLSLYAQVLNGNKIYK